MLNWLEYERFIAPIIETLLDTEKIDYSTRSKETGALLYYGNQTIKIKITKAYHQGEKFIALDDSLQEKVDSIICLGFAYYSSLEEKYDRDSQLLIKF